MNQHHNDDLTTRMTPLLRAIATEIVERSLAISRIESGLARARRNGNSREASTLEARLTHHKRELRHTNEELQRLGWERDGSRALRFLHGENDSWSLDGTAFYKAIV